MGSKKKKTRKIASMLSKWRKFNQKPMDEVHVDFDFDFDIEASKIMTGEQQTDITDDIVSNAMTSDIGPTFDVTTDRQKRLKRKPLATKTTSSIRSAGVTSATTAATMMENAGVFWEEAWKAMQRAKELQFLQAMKEQRSSSNYFVPSPRVTVTTPAPTTAHQLTYLATSHHSTTTTTAAPYVASTSSLGQDFGPKTLASSLRANAKYIRYLARACPAATTQEEMKLCSNFFDTYKTIWRKQKREKIKRVDCAKQKPNTRRSEPSLMQWTVETLMSPFQGLLRLWRRSGMRRRDEKA